jgi:hypothetical protein
MVIAHVGCNNPMTDFDSGCRVVALAAAANFRVLKVSAAYKHDIINLAYQRDFLQEKKKYDAVIVYSVFHTHTRYLRAAVYGSCAVSKLHSEEAWAKRLRGTGASWIALVDAAPMSLSGWHIHKLQGYEKHEWKYSMRPVLPGSVWLYVKKAPAGKAV